MKTETVVAWMLASVSCASQGRPATLDDLIACANYINRAAPFREEIEEGVNRLIAHGLVQVERDMFILTPAGHAMMEEVRARAQGVAFVIPYVEELLAKTSLPEVHHTSWNLSPEAFSAACIAHEIVMKAAWKKVMGKGSDRK